MAHETEARFYIENQYGEWYSTIEGKWIGPEWEPTLETKEYLDGVISNSPFYFEGCTIVEKA